jgi:hypothetical protein
MPWLSHHLEVMLQMNLALLGEEDCTEEDVCLKPGILHPF